MFVFSKWCWQRSRGDINTDTSEIQRITRSKIENLHSNNPWNLEDVDRLLDMCDLHKLSHEDIENLDQCNEIEAQIESFSKNRSPEPDRFSVEFYQTFNDLSPFPQIIPWNRKRGNTAKLIIWIQYHADTKIRQRYIKERKTQINIPD